MPRVDYSRPGFAVVYVEGPRSSKQRAELSIRSNRVRVRLDPEHSCVGLGGTIEIRNATTTTRVISDPAFGLVTRIAPGETIEVAADTAGPRSLFLLGADRSEATVFVAPGPFSVTSETGRFELSNLELGPVSLRAWHPRFPPTTRTVDIGSEGVHQVDLEIGVDSLHEDHR